MRHPAERVTPPLRAGRQCDRHVLLASAGLGRIAQGEAMPAGEFNQQVAAAQARGEGGRECQLRGAQARRRWLQIPLDQRSSRAVVLR